VSRVGPLPRPRRPRDPRVATLPAGRRALAGVSRPVFLAGILVDHAPAGATPLLAGIDLATGDDAATAVARALLTALHHDGFPVLPDDYLDQYDAYTGPDGVPLYCDYVPVDSGETYWEVWAHDDRPLPEALVAGIADGWMYGWDARESLATRARDTGADVAALVDRVLALEGRAGPSAAATLARDAGGISPHFPSHCTRCRSSRRSRRAKRAISSSIVTMNIGTNRSGARSGAGACRSCGAYAASGPMHWRSWPRSRKRGARWRIVRVGLASSHR